MKRVHRQLYMLSSGAICFGVLQAFEAVNFSQILAVFLANLFSAIVAIFSGNLIAPA
ncbi:MAG: hypothetical protein AB7N71_06805 [Phycisphaerae bacterium]